MLSHDGKHDQARGLGEPLEAKASGRQGAASSGAGFTRERIAKIFDPWQERRGILLAVSGGPDSVALMLLAAIWAQNRPAPFLRVATVDHGLRPGSGEEARAVAAFAEALGLRHDTLVWEGAKPRTRIQERAREVRYELLCALAERIGADCIATAHHADDQAETILFRLTRGSGVPGLAGMAPQSRRHGLLHSRPLMECGKDDLIAFCQARAHPYFDDPSNKDPRFARTRIRDLSLHLNEHGLDRDALLRLGHRAARAEAALSFCAKNARAALPANRTPDHFSADISALTSQPEEIVLRILAQEIKDLNKSRTIRLERLERLARSLHDALRVGAGFRASLGGTLLSLNSKGHLSIRPECRPERHPELRRSHPRLKPVRNQT
jgi:tRNA(Ile)-lysidine synthase